MRPAKGAERGARCASARRRPRHGGASRSARCGAAILATATLLALGITGAGCASSARDAARPPDASRTPDASAARPPGAPAGDPAGSLSARDVILDVSPAADVLALWSRGDRRASSAAPIAAGLAYRTLQAKLAERPYGCPTTRLEVARALANPDSGVCGFGLHPAWEARASIDSLVRAIAKDRSGIAARIAARAGAYLPRYPHRPVRIWFLVASQYTFDAITLESSADEDSVPVVIVNLPDVLFYARDTRDRVADLEHTLAHETFHAVLHQIWREASGWLEFRTGPLVAWREIAQVMVDEGVAHYVDRKDRPGADTLFVDRPGGRERFAFSQLNLAGRRLREENPGSPQWWETLQLASNGPLWSKYGAISGMFAAFRIERAAGRDSLVRAVGMGPPEFLRLYEEAARADTALGRLPPDLMRLE